VGIEIPHLKEVHRTAPSTQEGLHLTCRTLHGA
jgi:hypothetical protein